MLIQENLSTGKTEDAYRCSQVRCGLYSSGVKRKERRCYWEYIGGRNLPQPRWEMYILLKILLPISVSMTASIVNRCSNDVSGRHSRRTRCKLTIEFYRRNYIEGLFLSSGILYNANHTMELIYETYINYGTNGT